jgi:ATP-dependent Clp protease adaptor protein ClpS
MKQKIFQNISLKNTILNNTETISPQVQEVIEEIVDENIGTACKVILFNDEWHSFDEVINQILKAVKCSDKKAEELTWEVHSKGKACVYDGDMNECLKVSAILEEISLHTQIEY